MYCSTVRCDPSLSLHAWYLLFPFHQTSDCTVTEQCTLAPCFISLPTASKCWFYHLPSHCLKPKVLQSPFPLPQSTGSTVSLPTASNQRFYSLFPRSQTAGSTVSLPTTSNCWFYNLFPLPQTAGSTVSLPTTSNRWVYNFSSHYLKRLGLQCPSHYLKPLVLQSPFPLPQMAGSIIFPPPQTAGSVISLPAASKHWVYNLSSHYLKLLDLQSPFPLPQTVGSAVTDWLLQNSVSLQPLSVP